MVHACVRFEVQAAGDLQRCRAGGADFEDLHEGFAPFLHLFVAFGVAEEQCYHAVEGFLWWEGICQFWIFWFHVQLGGGPSLDGPLVRDQRFLHPGC